VSGTSIFDKIRGRFFENGEDKKHIREETNIAGRKRVSHTRFLDECKVAIGKRVEEEFKK
jgi:hypothetical protein